MGRNTNRIVQKGTKTSVKLVLKKNEKSTKMTKNREKYFFKLEKSSKIKTLEYWEIEQKIQNIKK